MHVIRNNSIVTKKFFLGFLVVLTFLAPLSVSFRETTSSISITSIKLTSAFAQTKDQIYGGATQAQTNAGQPATTPSTRGSTPREANQNANGSLKGGSDWGEKIGYAVLSTAAAITWVGGNLLEYSIDNLVFEMGEKLNTDGLGSSIDITWKVIRDICNLIFIFGFIYTGIRTIIDPESAETKRFVAQIIIAALLINFSLFFVKVITDFSNFTAVKIYSTMVSNTHDGDISTKFTELLGLKSLYKPLEGERLAGVTATGGIWFFILGAIMLLVAGFVLAAGGILLIVRFVALIFIMIFSPVLFAASVFPQTEEYSSKLWHHLISYAFFAPLFLLLLLISITVLNGAMGALGIKDDSLSGALVKADSYTVILNFVIVIMFLIFSLKTASSLGVAGGEMAVHMGDHLRKRGQVMMGNATAGLVAKGARATVGQVAQRVGHSDKLRDAASQKGVKGFLARRTLDATHATAHAGFDLRNVAGVGKTVGIGEGKKGGYDKDLKDKIEKEKKYAQGLGYNEHEEEHLEEHHGDIIKNAEQVVKDQKRASVVEQRPHRTRLQEVSARHAVEQNEDEKKKLKEEMDAINITIQNIKDINQEKIAEAEEAVKTAKAELENAKKTNKNARKIAYAKVVEAGIIPRPPVLRHGNIEAAHAILKEAKKDKSDNEKLLDEIKGLKNSGGGGSASAPAADSHH